MCVCKCFVPSKSEWVSMIIQVLNDIFDPSSKSKSFEDILPSDGELGLSDASPHALRRRKGTPYPRVPRSSPDTDSVTQADRHEGSQIDDDDFAEIYQPCSEDGYSNEDTDLRKSPHVTCSPTQPVDATILAGIQTLREVRIATNHWISSLGPLEGWPRVFQEHYDAACQRSTGGSTQEVDTFLESVERHVDVGRSILNKLRASDVIFPPSSHEAWGDFLAAGDFMETLYRGIALLEVRLDIFAPRGPTSLEGESSIRKWRGLIDQI